MRLHCKRAAWVTPIAFLVLLLAGGEPVRAGEPVTVELTTDQQVQMGDMVRVRVAVRDSSGGPVEGAVVVLLSPATFGSYSGEMRLGHVTTDSRGQATFQYQARREGEQTVIARFSGNDSYETAEASASLTVEGSAQLYEERQGVRVPGIGVWLLAVVLGGFWTVYLLAMVLVTLIAREGEAGDSISGASFG